MDENPNHASHPSQGEKTPRNPILTLLGFAIYLLFVPALLFLSAGTLRWPMAWVYTALLLLSTVGSRLVTLFKHPDLLRERGRFIEAEGTPTWDRILVPIVGLYGPMAAMIVAGLDHRWDWSRNVPPLMQYFATAAIAFGYGIAVWAMIVNRFFSAVARVQTDRDQVVVTSGPYRYLRHPSYAGALIASLALPLMLNALWTYIPAVAMCTALILRTSLEDRMLLEELDGYAAYASNTRYRLIPGIW
jgi:protein-S-isoprenylcysteine O-methyltransferase Ste14